MHTYIDKSIQKYTKERNTRQGVIHVHVLATHTCARAHAHAHINTHIDESTHKHTLTQIQIHRGIVTLNFSPRNLTQVTSTMKPGQDSMFGFSSVKRITLREGLY